MSNIYLLGGGDQEGVSVSFTALKATQKDGSLLRGVGVQPDILVPVTIDDIKQERDIQLARATEYLMNQLLQ